MNWLLRRAALWQNRGSYKSPTMHALACDLDHLEKHIDWHGSVTGQGSRMCGDSHVLTLYREQFEEQIAKDLDGFQGIITGIDCPVRPGVCPEFHGPFGSIQQRYRRSNINSRRHRSQWHRRGPAPLPHTLHNRC